MRIQFKPLFRIDIRHGFYADRRARALTLVPTESCRELMKRHKCRFRTDPTGGSVYYGVAEGDEPSLGGLSDEMPFGFALVSDDPNFDLYTDIADPDAGVIWRCFDNRSANKTAVAAAERYLLHPPGGSASGPPADPLPWSGSTSPWGQIEIYPGPMAADGYRLFGEDGAVTAREFTVALNERHTIWRYLVVAKDDDGADSWRIAGAPVNGARQDGTEPVTFGAPAETTLVGRRAWIFESETPVPLTERPGDRLSFTLKTGGPMDGRSLPSAQVRGTRLASAEGAEARMYSEILVYL